MMKDLSKVDDLIIRESAKEIGDKADSVGYLPMIIAMKGDSYTGKTTCANAIAKAYRCSIIRFDTILDSIAPSLPPSPQVALDLAFDVVLSVVRLQLRLCRPAVVDSPLSDSGHLDKLIQLADEFKSCEDKACDFRHCRVVIVECRPEAEYSWELKFRNKCGSSHNKWYNPKEWSDVVFTESVVDYPPGRLPDYVNRLIVDTTGYVDHRYLGAATLDLCGCPNGHLLNFHDRLPEHQQHEDDAILLMNTYSGRIRPEQRDNPDPATTAIICGNDGRHILEELTTLDGHDMSRCAACREPIEAPPAYYACKRCCNLALHKSCAELEQKTMIDHPNQLPPFLRKLVSNVNEYYSLIPEEYRQSCGRSSCGEFSVECEACLWEAHLRLGVVPTVLRHEGHDHQIMCFWITTSGREYQCGACKETGWFTGYTCLEGSFRYNLHVECALLRRPWSHVHGGHHHLMDLSFSTVEATDDFYCEECQEPRDPTAWYYSCTQCHYVCHLHCVYAPVIDT